MNLQETAQRVKQAREDQRLSTEKAAQKAGINRVTWKRIENGQRVQDVKLRSALDALGITATDEPTPGQQMRVTRERSGMSRRDFAEVLEIGAGALGEMESGAAEVPPSVRKRVLALFGADELLAELSRRIQDRVV